MIDDKYMATKTPGRKVAQSLSESWCLSVLVASLAGQDY